MKTAIAVLALCISSMAMAQMGWVDDQCYGGSGACGGCYCSTANNTCCAGGSCVCENVPQSAYAPAWYDGGLNQCCNTTNQTSPESRVVTGHCTSNNQCCGFATTQDALCVLEGDGLKHCCSKLDHVGGDGARHAGPCLDVTDCCDYYTPPGPGVPYNEGLSCTGGRCCIEDGKNNYASPSAAACCSDAVAGHGYTFCTCVPSGDGNVPLVCDIGGGHCPCTADTDCCSGFCGVFSTPTNPSLGCMDSCVAPAGHCLDDHDCCSGTLCSSGSLAFSTCCGGPGFGCTSGSQCCNGACAGGTCGCYSTGSACSPNGHNPACCSETCTAGSCT